MSDALYGPNGFFRRPAPADHFRTSAHTGPVFAAAIARVLAAVDTALDHPAELDVVDVGAGQGELLAALEAQVSAELRARLRLRAVEVARRPDHLLDRIGWDDRLPDRITGLLLATEWLDNVPVEVVMADADGRARVARSVLEAAS